MRYHRSSSALVGHVNIDKKNHMPDWNNANIFNKNLCKKRRQALEVVYIIKVTNTVNKKTGDVVWSSLLAAVS